MTTRKTIWVYFRSEEFDTIGFQESVWRRPAGGKYAEDISGGKYAEDIFASAHVDD